MMVTDAGLVGDLSFINSISAALRVIHCATAGK
jgi:hypothetical protein